MLKSLNSTNEKLLEIIFININFKNQFNILINKLFVKYIRNNNVLAL